MNLRRRGDQEHASAVVIVQVARVISIGNSQTVQLPKQFRLPSGEVYIRKDVATGDS